jgi:hypothetical protein
VFKADANTLHCYAQPGLPLKGGVELICKGEPLPPDKVLEGSRTQRAERHFVRSGGRQSLE